MFLINTAKIIWNWSKICIVWIGKKKKTFVISRSWTASTKLCFENLIPYFSKKELIEIHFIPLKIKILVNTIRIIIKISYFAGKLDSTCTL